MGGGLPSNAMNKQNAATNPWEPHSIRQQQRSHQAPTKHTERHPPTHLQVRGREGGEGHAALLGHAHGGAREMVGLAEGDALVGLYMLRELG